VIAAAGLVGALAVLGDQALESHAAGRHEQLGADLALLKGAAKWRYNARSAPAATHRPYRMTLRGRLDGPNELLVNITRPAALGYGAKPCRDGGCNGAD